MGLVTGLARLVPGVRHIASGWSLAGVGWFFAFALPLNAGVVAPYAWPGEEARAARVVLCGTALVIGWMAHRRASVMERLARRRAFREHGDGGGAASRAG
jgi:hypothetical protein